MKDDSLVRNQLHSLCKWALMIEIAEADAPDLKDLQAAVIEFRKAAQVAVETVFRPAANDERCPRCGMGTLYLDGGESRSTSNGYVLRTRTYLRCDNRECSLAIPEKERN
jgi:hypothetical protein